jgi:hypothetical protein
MLGMRIEFQDNKDIEKSPQSQRSLAFFSRGSYIALLEPLIHEFSPLRGIECKEAA